MTAHHKKRRPGGKTRSPSISLSNNQRLAPPIDASIPLASGLCPLPRSAGAEQCPRVT